MHGGNFSGGHHGGGGSGHHHHGSDPNLPSNGGPRGPSNMRLVPTVIAVVIVAVLIVLYSHLV
jgi:hypothetical protein